MEQIELTEKEHDVESSGDVQGVIEETSQVRVFTIPNGLKGIEGAVHELSSSSTLKPNLDR